MGSRFRAFGAERDVQHCPPIEPPAEGVERRKAPLINHAVSGVRGLNAGRPPHDAPPRRLFAPEPFFRDWPDEPRPPLSRRLSPAFDQTNVQQAYLQPLIIRSGRPTQSVPEAGLRAPPAGAALIPRLVASLDTPLFGMR